jgi:NAD dependent epimerase/dehydratase family enzyme
MTMSATPRSVFDVMATLARRGVLGTYGSGKQYVSWIHERDFCRSIELLLADSSLEGPINLCSPNPLPNWEFNRILRRAVGAKLGLPAPAWALEIGAAMMKTETELILKSRRVVPARLLQHGFKFYFPDWKEAALEISSRLKT